MKKGLFALALGTFGFGISEYVMMSILPDIATDFNISISTAGHFISAYAIGVCTGAPLFAILTRNIPLKKALILLLMVYVIGNILFSVSSNYTMGIIGRFIAGLPHGAYFGTGALIASRLATGNKSTAAVAMMVMGMTVANLVGVPLGSLIGNSLSWRPIFYFTSMWGIVTYLAVRFMVPDIGSLPHSDIKGQFRFLKSMNPWILIGVTMTCNGGAFCMYSYVSPLMTEAGLPQSLIPAFMIVVGAGMCIGNYIGGKMSDRYSTEIVAQWITVIMTCSLTASFLLASHMTGEAISVIIATTCLFAISPVMQLLLIEYSPGGELMGGAMVQIAFNLGNAIGALVGGIPLSHGLSAGHTAISGAAIAFISVILMILFRRRKKNSPPQQL